VETGIKRRRRRWEEGKGGGIGRAVGGGQRSRERRKNLKDGNGVGCGGGERRLGVLSLGVRAGCGRWAPDGLGWVGVDGVVDEVVVGRGEAGCGGCDVG
jgi:hypothetical protein